MDLVLGTCDRFVLTPLIYPASWKEDDWTRQLLSLYLITWIGGWLLYFFTASFSYFFLFDEKWTKHKLFLSRQVWLEIACATKSIPGMALLTFPIFFLEVRGYSKLYMGVTTLSDWVYLAVSIGAFLMFTDCLIYWIHRGLHYGVFYKVIHKTHHKWKVPTPFASHAFHPVDGFLQSVPYHIFPFLFPLHKVAFLCLFLFVNIWTVSIHDGEYRVPPVLQPIVNGSAHHTYHHLFYNCNYGQFFTLWDRIGNSIKFPEVYSGKKSL